VLIYFCYRLQYRWHHGCVIYPDLSGLPCTTQWNSSKNPYRYG